MVLLCVKNQLVEDICDVSVSIDLKLPVSITRLVVGDYCRDGKILNSAPVFHIRPESPLGHKKFTGFLNYLKDRKKVAITKVASGDSIYILPPTEEDCALTRLGCLRIQRTPAATAAATSQPHPAPLPPPPPVPRSQPVATAAAFSSSSGGTGDGCGGGGFSLISDLLQKAEADQNWRQSSETVAAPRKQVKNAYAEFENYVRSRITAHFPDIRSTLEAGGLVGLQVTEAGAGSSRSGGGDGDDSLDDALFMEPMEKSQRYIVHDIVSGEYAGKLLTASDGERADRHVVVYRVDHPPKGVKLENFVDPTSIQSVQGGGMAAQTHSRRHAQMHQQKALQAVGEEGLTKVGTVKRDRRTLEEIQQENKRRRMASAGETNDHSDDLF